jgi:Zn-dependent protease
MNLLYGRRGEAIVAAAGPISNLVLAAAAAIPLRYLDATPDLRDQVGLLYDILRLFVGINILLMLFNLIPIPPLDGSKVLFAFVDRRTEYQVRPILEQYGFLILLALFFLPPGGSIGGRILLPIFNAIFSFLVGR